MTRLSLSDFQVQVPYGGPAYVALRLYAALYVVASSLVTVGLLDAGQWKKLTAKWVNQWWNINWSILLLKFSQENVCLWWKQTEYRIFCHCFWFIKCFFEFRPCCGHRVRAAAPLFVGKEGCHLRLWCWAAGWIDSLHQHFSLVSLIILLSFVHIAFVTMQ